MSVDSTTQQRRSASQEIAAWVTETFTAQTVDGVTVYDLSNAGEG
ncbi:hypothetical protein [Micromonospora sp. NPDC005087]